MNNHTHGFSTGSLNDAYGQASMACDPGARRPLTIDLFEALETLEKTIDDTADQLFVLEGRVFGSVPTAGGGCGPEGPAGCVSDRLANAIQRLLRKASVAHSTSITLNGRI